MAFLASCRGRMLVVLLLSMQQVLSTPILLYHSLEELSGHALSALPSTAGIHWVIGEKNQRIATDKFLTEAVNTGIASMQRRDYLSQSPDECHDRAQMFAEYALKPSSAVVAVTVILIISNIPVTTLLVLAARRLRNQYGPQDSTPPTTEESRPAGLERNAFAEQRRKALEDEKAALGSSSIGSQSNTDCTRHRRQHSWLPFFRLLDQAALFVTISVLYLCCWATVLLAPFSIEAFTLCRVGYEPSSALLAGLWTLYGICDVGVMLASTCYLVHAIRETLKDDDNSTKATANGERRRMWPGGRGGNDVPHTPASQRTLLRRSGDSYTRRPSARSRQRLPITSSVPSLPTVRSDASKAFSNAEDLLAADRPPTSRAGYMGRAPPERDILAILRNPYGMLSATRSRISQSSFSRSGRQDSSMRSRPGSSAQGPMAEYGVEGSCDGSEAPAIPRRAVSPAASSYYGPRKSMATLRSHAGHRESVQETWREYAEGFRNSPYDRD